MEFRDRRMGEDVVLRKYDPPIQQLCSPVDALEYERNGRGLKGAAHRKALVAAVSDDRPCGRIHDRASEPPSATFIDLGQASLQLPIVVSPGQAARHSWRGERKKRPGQCVTARHRMQHSFYSSTGNVASKTSLHTSELTQF